MNNASVTQAIAGLLSEFTAQSEAHAVKLPFEEKLRTYENVQGTNTNFLLYNKSTCMEKRDIGSGSHLHRAPRSHNLSATCFVLPPCVCTGSTLWGRWKEIRREITNHVLPVLE